jgi:mono/diheme cytochrome c family protein
MDRNRRRNLRRLAAAAFAAAAGLAEPAAADPLAGEEAFRDFCAGCHGETARGDGPMTEILTVAVPDLTGLAARNGGSFPWHAALRAIEAGGGVAAHGGPMPVFGALFDDDRVLAEAPDGSLVETSARIAAILEWLASVQAEGG